MARRYPYNIKGIMRKVLSEHPNLSASTVRTYFATELEAQGYDTRQLPGDLTRTFYAVKRESRLSTKAIHLSPEVKQHIVKARESALLAVEIYNKPATTFRSGGFIVMMCIAWTALFHAIFLHRKEKPFYRDKNNPKQFLKLDGDNKAWELSECIKNYWKGITNAITINLEFFIGLRNKVEHRSMPELDHRIFDKCQSLLFNFEDMLFNEFGAEWALNESLSLAIQFSQLRNHKQSEAIRRLHKPLAKDVDKYITNFQSALSNEILHDLQYSFKVFILPKLVANPGKADAAVEYIQYDPTNEEDAANYSRLVAMIKPSVTQVANQGRLRPCDVCFQVEPVVKQVVGDNAKFTASSHHVRACYHYKVRPRKADGDRRKTDTRFCHYDEAHNDYVYTREWVKFLISELRKPGQYEIIMKGSR